MLIDVLKTPQLYSFLEPRQELNSLVAAWLVAFSKQFPYPVQIGKPRLHQVRAKLPFLLNVMEAEPVQPSHKILA